jgi:hypothetical protein
MRKWADRRRHIGAVFLMVQAGCYRKTLNGYPGRGQGQEGVIAYMAWETAYHRLNRIYLVFRPRPERTRRWSDGADRACP